MKKEKEVLLITYYWPPAGGAGVHRWLRFSKFFKENGWKLHVYCPDNAEWPIIDKDLEKEVSPDLTIIRKGIFEPHKYLGKKNNPNAGSGITRKEKGSFLGDLLIWTRGNLFVPDARVFWIRPSTRFLHSYLKKHPEISTVISTGPPHSLHVIGRNLKRKHPSIQWVADFRDPWTEIDFYKELSPGKWADHRQKKLEKACLTEADAVVTISKSSAEDLERIGNRKIEVITNGYTFPHFDETQQKTDLKFSISHIGSMPFSRNPEIIWKALSDICKSNPTFQKDLQIKLIGSVDYTVFERLKFYELQNNTEHIKQVSHGTSIELQRSSQIILLVANNTGNVKGILTGKFFEYLGARRPILTVGEKGSDLETAISLTDSGVFIDYDDLQKAKDTILEWYQLFLSGNLRSHSKNLHSYSSEHLAADYCRLLDSLLS